MMPVIAADVLERRRWLCGQPVTLDGKPAAISGAAEPYAEVRILPDGFRWHWSWAAVEHIVAQGGRFRS